MDGFKGHAPERNRPHSGNATYRDRSRESEVTPSLVPDSEIDGGAKQPIQDGSLTPSALNRSTVNPLKTSRVLHIASSLAAKSFFLEIVALPTEGARHDCRAEQSPLWP